MNSKRANLRIVDMARLIKRTVYLLRLGQRYLDRDGDPVEGWSEAINFGCASTAQAFIDETPGIAAKHPRIVSHEFSDKDLMSFMKAEGMHLRLKNRSPEE